MNVSTGLFITPHDLGDLLTPSQQTNLVRATESHVDVPGPTDPLPITELLWPAEPVLAGYRSLEAALDCTPESAYRPENTLATQLQLAETLEIALRPDALIPPELRAQP